MDTAGWALCISILSAVVACCSLGWNIYKELALKARLKVQVDIGKFLAEGREPSEDHIMIEATNFGPGKIKLETVRLQRSSRWLRLLRRTQHAVLVYDYKNPLSGKLPITLDVGERVMYPFPFRKDCFLNERYTHVGIRDSFGRTHWAPRSSYREAKRKWDARYGGES